MSKELLVDQMTTSQSHLIPLIVRERYLALGGEFVQIVKLGCDHHPHGLADPSPVVNFILAHCAQGEVAAKALAVASQSGSITKLAPGKC
jgi:hypothetical protein